MKKRPVALLLIAAGAGLLLIADGRHEATDVIAQSATAGCPVTAPTVVQGSAALQVFAASGSGGVVYNSSASQLELPKKGGEFTEQVLPAAFTGGGIPTIACAADFDGDGWTDIVGAINGNQLGFYKNQTGDNQVPPSLLPSWNDPNYQTPPKFVLGNGGSYFPSFGPSVTGSAAMGCGDINGDLVPDLLYIQVSGTAGGTPAFASVFLGLEDPLNPGRGTGDFAPPYQLTNASGATALDAFRDLRSDSNLSMVDYNGDGRLDFIFGAEDPGVPGTGFVQVFLNDNGTGHTATPLQPTFTTGVSLVSGIAPVSAGVHGLAVGDVTGDGIPDVTVATGTTAIPVYPGLASGGLDIGGVLPVNNTQPDSAIVLTEDFNGDGKKDLMMATHLSGGTLLYWENSGLVNPFGAAYSKNITEGFGRFDFGLLINYDNDPDNTPDVLFGDASGVGRYGVLANRVGSSYVDCAEIESGVLDLGALASTKMVVDGVRLVPNQSEPLGTSISYFASNETPANWVPANATAICGAGAFCASFPAPTGRDVRWKAVLCSDASKSQTPTIQSMDVTFEYTPAAEHYRAGVVVSDGVAYVGAFRQPGDEGHLYAVNAGITTTYWDFATKLDAMADADRNMYTADISGQNRLDFTVASAGNGSLQSVLGVGNAAAATQLIEWQRSPRFGIGGTSRLGSIEGSTPAVVGPPGLPVWYPRANTALKASVDAFRTVHATRPTIVLVGSKDGALHGVRSIPTNITDPLNGTEAWAFVPAKVAQLFFANKSSGVVTSYPDGSPAVADVVFADNSIHTVAVTGGGRGHRGFFALDVSDTVTPGGVVLGPTPLWHILPGGAQAGAATSKPVIIRVSVAGVDKFYAVMATGVAPENPVAPFTKGLEVVAVDIETGSVAWRFQSECAVTSNLVAFETDDVLEPGSPTFDGYIDRVVWADMCGNVYKVDPAQSGGSFIAGMGGISTGSIDPSGNPVKAIFATASTTCAIGDTPPNGDSGERPIAGTIGARSDTSGRLALFFGTGGIESFDPSLDNAFYAVYADTGEIRGCAGGTPAEGRLLGTCTAGACEKFYGGVVVTASDVIVTRSTDAPIATGTCEFGSSSIAGISIADLSATASFNVTTSSATVGSIYGDAGAVYVATLSGDIIKIGTPRAANAGGDTSGGTGGGQAQVGDGGNAGQGVGILGWRVLQ